MNQRSIREIGIKQWKRLVCAFPAVVLLFFWMFPCQTSGMICLEDEELGLVAASAGGAQFGIVNDPDDAYGYRSTGRYLPTSPNPLYTLQTWLFSEPTVFQPVRPASGTRAHDLKAYDYGVQLVLEGVMTNDLFTTGQFDTPALPASNWGIPYFYLTLYTNHNYDAVIPADMIDSRMNMSVANAEFWRYDATAGFNPYSSWNAYNGVNFSGMNANTVYWRTNRLTALDLIGLRIPYIYYYLGRHKSGTGCNVEIGGQLKVQEFTLDFLNPQTGARNTQKGRVMGLTMAGSFGGNTSLYGTTDRDNWEKPSSMTGGWMSGNFTIGDVFGARTFFVNPTTGLPSTNPRPNPGMMDIATNSTLDMSSQCYGKTFYYVRMGTMMGSLRVREILGEGAPAYPSWASGSSIIQPNTGVFSGGPPNSSFGPAAVDGIRVYYCDMFFPGSYYQDDFSPLNNGVSAGSESYAYYARPMVRTCILNPSAAMPSRLNRTNGCETPRSFW